MFSWDVRISLVHWVVHVLSLLTFLGLLVLHGRKISPGNNDFSFLDKPSELFKRRTCF